MPATITRFPGATLRWDVIGIGASCIDQVYRVPVFPVAGAAASKVRIRSRMVGCGGQTATTLATCSRLGLRAKYVGVVGADEHGRWIRDALDRHQIDTADLAVHEYPTASAVILIDDAGDRLVLWDRDERLLLPPECLPLAALARARLVHVDDVDERAATAAAFLARDAGIPVTCDIDHVTDRTADLLALVNLPVFAQHVPQQLTGEPSQDQALRALRRRHPGVLCVTMGEGGAMALEGDVLHRVPAFRVDPVDTGRAMRFEAATSMPI
jgi:sugar/nucleoside kinase (ribokinase family)